MRTIILMSLVLFLSFNVAAQDTQELVGKWKLDMSPQDTTDSNFAMMEIIRVKGNEMYGTFYREGVKLRSGQLNTQTGTIYGALISGDNSGEYNTSFYLKDGKLYGTTHAIDRGFLAVWVATKEN
ncbi:MAG: hypothetical protein R8G66_15445 [Cytophagales bacterium]|nr:hypothetical protein [Cytophagales bacterium]